MKHIVHLFYAAALMALFLPAWLLCESPASANPTGGSVAQGSATIKSSGSQVIVNQTSPTAFINWSTFDINNTESVTFNQPSAASIAWNYIQESQPSTINGTITANGYVILQNPYGFSVGGTAAISAHGLIMTTASTPNLSLTSGDPWSFNTPPPTAKIINYGQINTAGGPAYLIANDIENYGGISAKGGQIGLYAGETVLVSMSPNGEGLSAKVTMPQGSVDNEGNLVADGGAIVAQAQTVNQDGVAQANAAENVNGTIELVGDSSVTLGADSAISATGDSTASSASAGGSVQIQAGTSFSDAGGSSINVSGASLGGNAGQVSISAPQMSALNTTINGQAAAGYLNGTLNIDTAGIALNSDGSPAAGALALDVAALSSGFSQINLEASDNITLSAPWTLAVNGGIPSSVLLQAGNEITLGSGSGIQANGGNITLKAPTVDQGGILQANSVGSANGVIEIDASQNLILEASSAISANGDPTATTTPSPGGFVVLNAGNLYSDFSGSTISVSGNAAGGQGGIVEIFDPLAGTTPIQTTTAGAFAYLVNPFDMTLSGSPTVTSSSPSSNPNFNLSDLATYSRIDLQSLDDITLTADWILNPSTLPATLDLTAGNDINVGNASLAGGINAGKNWAVNLTAGTAQPTPASGSDGIYLYNSADVQTINGNINLWAANEVQVGWTGSSSGAGVINLGDGSITTLSGGNICVNALSGDVNTGSDPLGFLYQKTAPYYTVSTSLGGISTAAGGNVTINAGGNVISYLPSGTTATDAGSGAFGSKPGNVTITAGGSIYGHYVLANGVGTITAGGTIGAPNGPDSFALSLIDGTWNVNAPNGNIYLQEVRNPNGDFNNKGTVNSPGYNLFNYGADAAVNLNAGIGVYLTDEDVPRTAASPIPVIYPSILDITAGSSGVTLQDNVTLFPSVDQNLEITTTDSGSLVSAPNDPGEIPELLMSDSSQTRWNFNINTGITAFSDTDNGNVLPIDADDEVTLNIAGNMENLTLITTKATQIHVKGNMENCGFSGQNLQASDVTSITVDGQIYNQSSYSFINNVAIPNVPAGDLLPGMGNSWNDIFALAVSQAGIANVNLAALATMPPSQWADYILEQAAVFGDTVQSGAINVVNIPNFIYNPATGQLGYGGQMSQLALSEFGTPGQAIYVLHLVNGVPVISNGQLVLDQVSWAPASAVQTLYTDSINAPNPNDPSVGYRIGGPGQFDINAGSISLGNSSGILSCGVSDPTGGFDRYNDLVSITPVGATVNVTVSGDLDMLTSTIATLGGGDVNVLSTGGSLDLGSEDLSTQTRQVGFGVFTAGPGNVSVTALDDIDIDGSRIATFDGGDISIESLEGNVDIGNGGDTFDSVYLSYVDPSGHANHYVEGIYGSGVVAYTLSTPEPGASYLLPGSDWPLDHANTPGNITIKTPQGNITSGLGGITQESLNENISGNPIIKLIAGTDPTGTVGDPDYSAGYIGSINLGPAGLFANTVVIKATGNVTGPIVAVGNATINAGKNFIGSLISGGVADVSAGGDVAGLVVGLGGVNVSGESVTADVLGQDVSINGGSSESTLGTTATATSASQSAANQSDTQAKQQLASNDDDEKKKKKLKPQIQRVKRVTVILPNKG